VAGWRPRTKLTPELGAEVDLAAGRQVAVVAQRHRITRRTLTRWNAQGRVVRRELAAEPRHETVTAEEVSLDDRLAKAEPGLVASIIARGVHKLDLHAAAE
jgi:hypothetical protein